VLELVALTRVLVVRQQAAALAHRRLALPQRVRRRAVLLRRVLVAR
jgi:hypothetical protein